MHECGEHCRAFPQECPKNQPLEVNITPEAKRKIEGSGLPDVASLFLPRGSDHVMGGGGPHPLDKIGDLPWSDPNSFPLEDLRKVRKDIETFGEQYKRQDLEAAAETLLGGIVPGWTKDNDHSAETPARFVKMLRQLCEPVPEWNFTTFPAETDNMVVLGPIPFYTLCAHHVVPFHGTAFVGYVPDRVVAGLSKFPRAVRAVAKGLHVQETLTTQIADFLEAKLEPKGLAVVLKAEHMCMAMRGVEVAGVITTTAEMRGVFSDHSRTAKAEFLEWIRDAR